MADYPPPQLTEHGVFMNVYGQGVLIAGASGIGKSEVALFLVDRGHRLIADDSIYFYQSEDKNILGYCPPLLKNFLEVRGLGILNIEKLYGKESIYAQMPLNLIINLQVLNNKEKANIDRLNGHQRTKEILGQAIPEVQLPIAPGRNLSVLVEVAVKNQILKNQGYHAGAEFTKQQSEEVKK